MAPKKRKQASIPSESSCRKSARVGGKDRPTEAGEESVESVGEWSDVGEDKSGQRSLMITLNNTKCDGISKVAGFDIDSTIIKTASGRTFATGVSDWMWLYPCVPEKLKELDATGYRVCFFTNQAGIEKGKVDIRTVKTKIMNIITELGITIFVFISTGQDHYRKPSTTMWDYMVNKCNKGVKLQLSDCLYVGDAAGREKNWAPGKPKDFSCTDRMFAANIGIKFYTPEAFFLGECEAPFKWRSIDASKFIPLAKKSQQPMQYHKMSSGTELVILVGLPASGKSTFCKRYFIPHGYMHINRDTLSTQAKCVKAASDALSSGKSVIIDNTNPSPSARTEYVNLAKKYGVSCRCIIMQTDEEMCHHLNLLRQNRTEGGVRRIPDVGYNVYKKNYQRPALSEGFTEIVDVPFTVEFDDKEHERLFKQWTA